MSVLRPCSEIDFPTVGNLRSVFCSEVTQHLCMHFSDELSQSAVGPSRRVWFHVKSACGHTRDTEPLSAALALSASFLPAGVEVGSSVLTHWGTVCINKSESESSHQMQEHTGQPLNLQRICNLPKITQPIRIKKKRGTRSQGFCITVALSLHIMYFLSKVGTPGFMRIPTGCAPESCTLFPSFLNVCCQNRVYK